MQVQSNRRRLLALVLAGGLAIGAGAGAVGAVAYELMGDHDRTVTIQHKRDPSARQVQCGPFDGQPNGRGGCGLD